MHIFLCRPEFETCLIVELGQGTVVSSGVVSSDHLPEAPLIFERQRIPNASFVPALDLKPLSDETAGSILASLHRIETPVKRWSVHAYTPDGKDANRAEGLARALLRQCRDLEPELHRQHRPKMKPDQHVLQLCRTPAGLFHGLAPFTDLSSPKPGGVLRMTMDSEAPSRSYLKLEEALARQGWTPADGQTVIDLGAASGGWSHAFLKRGCLVTSVDNGPMKIGSPLLEHIQADGISFPARQVDYLVADMLIPPGSCLGMLRNWLPGRFPGRVIANIKLPQQEPMVALRPLLDWLAKQPYRFEVRQLYHDRREVTLMAEALS